MTPDNTSSGRFEYYNTSNPDLECIRSNYKNLPLHLITIKDNVYVLADDICYYLNIPDDTAIWLLEKIPDSAKTTERMRRLRGDAEYELAMLTEEGLCRLVELVNTPEAYDFLHDVQEMFKYQGNPDTDVATRIAEQFARVKRKRIEANPSSLQSLDSRISSVLSAPSLYRGRLNSRPVQPASMLTIAASVPLQVYQDADGNLWFSSNSIMKALGHSLVADPSTVFRNVPPCWIADIESENSEGEVTSITCILLQGVLFYLSDSTNLYSVYLMYYIALKLGMRNKDNPKHAVDSIPLMTKRILLENDSPSSSSESEKKYVRWLMDRTGIRCYLLADILKVIDVEMEEAERILQTIPVKFKKILLVKVEPKSGYMQCITEQGLWFLLSAFSNRPSVAWVIQKLADLQPDAEDSLSLSRTLNGWNWPYIADPDQIPSYDAQIRGLEVLLSSYNRQNLTECGFWGLNALVEMTTGISPLTIIHRWERNKSKEAEHFEEKEADRDE